MGGRHDFVTLGGFIRSGRVGSVSEEGRNFVEGREVRKRRNRVNPGMEPIGREPPEGPDVSTPTQSPRVDTRVVGWQMREYNEWYDLIRPILMDK